MKKLTLYSKGLVPLGFHGTDTCLYQVPGRIIELLLPQLQLATGRDGLVPESTVGS